MKELNFKEKLERLRCINLPSLRIFIKELDEYLQNTKDTDLDEKEILRIIRGLKGITDIICDTWGIDYAWTDGDIERLKGLKDTIEKEYIVKKD